MSIIPKIIENAKELIAAETMRQINEIGYRQMTVRSVAKACGMAVGTVYNYYPSKDEMVASVVLDDWGRFVDGMREELPRALSAEEAFRLIYGGCAKFIDELRPLFTDTSAVAAYAVTHSVLHENVNRQLADLILPTVASVKAENQDFTAVFLAESILALTRADIPFETAWSVMRRIL